MMAKLLVENVAEFKRNLDKADKQRVKAAQTAVRVEGYRLLKKLKLEIREGAPGGSHFAPFSFIAKSLGRRKKNPLMRLASVARYAIRKDGNDMTMSIGWPGGDILPGRPTGKDYNLSQSWLRIARVQQEGFKVRKGMSVPGAMGAALQGESYLQYFIRRGARLGKRSKYRKYLFLKKSTKWLETPARPIIEPFWRANKSEAERNIEQNFVRKMAGERI